MTTIISTAEQLAAAPLGPVESFLTVDPFVVGETAEGAPIVRGMTDACPSDWLQINAPHGVSVSADGDTIDIGVDLDWLGGLTLAQVRVLRAALVHAEALLAAAPLEPSLAAITDQWHKLGGRLERLWAERLGFGAWLELSEAQRAALVSVAAAVKQGTPPADLEPLRDLPKPARQAVAAWLTDESEAVLEAT